MERVGSEEGGLGLLKSVAMALSGAAIGALLGGAPELMFRKSPTTPAALVSQQTATSSAHTPSTYEILAFEAPGCAYCTQFRNDIDRTYSRSGYAALAPVRFVNWEAHDANGGKLSRVVTTLPTAVVLRDGVEVGRIDGYVGRENFYRILETLIAR